MKNLILFLFILSAGRVLADDVFLGSLKMNVTTTKAGKATSMSMHFYIRDPETVIETDFGKGTARMIFNTQTKTITTLMTDGGKKTGMKMKMQEVTIPDADKDTKEYTIKKTGEIKVVSGYQAEKYIITYTDGDHADVWIALDLKFNIAGLMEMLNTNMKGKGPSISGKYPSMSGLPIEMTHYAVDGTTTLTTFSDIFIGQPDATKFSTDGYEVIDLSNLPSFKQ